MLKIGFFNARSICNKLSSVIDLLIQHELHLLFVVETWMHENDSTIIHEIKEYGYDIRPCQNCMMFSKVYDKFPKVANWDRYKACKIFWRNIESLRPDSGPEI